MSVKISVPVLWDENNNFLNGELFGVDAEAQVIGVVQKPTGKTVPPYTSTDLVDTVYVKDKVLGGLYLQLTLAQWQYEVGLTQNIGITIPDAGGVSLPLYEIAIGTGTGIGSTPAFTATPGVGVVLQTDMTMNHIIGGTLTPAISVGPGAGTGARATIVGDDMGGYIDLTTGTGLATSSIIFTVAFAVPYQSAPKLVMLNPANEAAMGLYAAAGKMPLVPCVPDANAPTETQFSTISNNVGVLAASTEYSFWYFVKQ